MKRPPLRPIPLDPDCRFPQGAILVALKPNQWGPFFDIAYSRGYILLELDSDGSPTAAFQLGQPRHKAEVAHTRD